MAGYIGQDYHNGTDGKAWTTSVAQGAPATTTLGLELAVTKWDARITSDVQDYSNVRDGRWRIPGNDDVEGTLTMHFDAAHRPTDATGGTGPHPNIRHGSILDVQLSVDGSDVRVNCFRYRIILNQVEYSSDWNGAIDFNCSYRLQSGPILYPGDPDPAAPPPP
jgi:hypothetical protein